MYLVVHGIIDNATSDCRISKVVLIEVSGKKNDYLTDMFCWTAATARRKVSTSKNCASMISAGDLECWKRYFLFSNLRTLLREKS